MKSLAQLKSSAIRTVLTDIDGTLTLRGRLPASTYSALWVLKEAGLNIIPVTGRPAGWCDLIARLWPVHGVVGENGAFYFRLVGEKMRRHFARRPGQRRLDRLKLGTIANEVRAAVPGSALASDQFARMFDLAIDFRESVQPLSAKQVDNIVDLFRKHGATAKVSNIHVNGWFGQHDKLSTCLHYLRREFAMNEKQMRETCLFIGDSPNDEPMFKFFPHSVAVANIREFLPTLRHKPAYVTRAEEGEGFCELMARLLVLQS